MKKSDVLRELFDEKIIKIINIFLEEPEKHFSLTQTSSVAKVNVATTLRILDRLVKKEIVEITFMGKSKFYKLKQGEKTIALGRLLKKEEHITDFIDRVKEIPKIKRIILESKTDDGAKVILVGSPVPSDKIAIIIKEIEEKYSFKIQYIELSEDQFEGMEKMGLYNLNKKIIWDRDQKEE
ncbi:MAG: hypothetical protein KKE05_04085 [Nanoarchaeota archaeon]|nr:hypothetical protein [Nanoarchaeota archaeon]